MTKPITIAAPSTAWAAVNRAGAIWAIDTFQRTKKRYAEFYFGGKYETDFKPHGWRIVRVVITPMKKADTK